MLKTIVRVFQIMGLIYIHFYLACTRDDLRCLSNIVVRKENVSNRKGSPDKAEILSPRYISTVKHDHREQARTHKNTGLQLILLLYSETYVP